MTTGTEIQSPQPAPAHTPGPWLFSHREGADRMFRTEVFSAEHGGIATCDWTPKHCGNGVTATYREANARLIAAAPELLAALRAMEAMYTHAWDRTDGGLLMMPGSVERFDAACEKARATIAKATGAQA